MSPLPFLSFLFFSIIFFSLFYIPKEKIKTNSLITLLISMFHVTDFCPLHNFKAFREKEADHMEHHMGLPFELMDTKQMLQIVKL